MFAYLLYTLTLIAIYGIASLGYAIPVGYTGMLNFGQVGFLAIGAYSAAILGGVGVPFWLALVAASVITACASFLLALPARKVQAEYYALLSLGFIFIVNAIILNATPLTGGPFGISGIHRPALLASPEAFLVVTLGVLCAVGIFVYRVLESPFGRALEAVRDDDAVAESLGKPSAKLRIVSLVLSAFITGIAGGLLAYFLQFINAQVFWLDNAVFVLAIIVVGGLASFRGALFGTVVLFAILESVRFLPISPLVLGPIRIIIFSLLLLLILLFRPKGIMGRAQLD